ncbi:hypothetical protein FOA52_007396 [Chlamydomonas sp. UWO 241]|nr:hypothetical protein FOA52_007396 [Chlamydomonas sp. UWO 241]
MEMPGDDGDAEDWAELAVEAAARGAAAAETRVSLPFCLAASVIRYAQNDYREWPDGGVASASFLNATPAVGGIGVQPRRGGVLRVLFTVTSDVMADTVVRFCCNLRNTGRTSIIFDVLSYTEEAQRRALWPPFVAAKAAGKRAQFLRARLMIDGKQVPPPARKSDN